MKKRTLRFWEIWNMSVGFLGIQFGFALQNANTSRIFETLGANVDDIPILWIAAPVTGLLVQPIIGYFSDRTWTRLGRRRPYFLVGAIMASVALFIMPNSPVLWIAAGMLWIMDASINISMEPFRAFVGDNLPSEQRTLGFAMQSFFIGTGAVVGSALPYMLTNWFGLDNTAPEGIIPQSVKWSFYLGGIVFLSAVLWTVFSSKEYPPEELEAFEENKTIPIPQITTEENISKIKKLLHYGVVLILVGGIFTLVLAYINVEKELYILSTGLLLAGLLFAVASYVRKVKGRTGFVIIMSDLLYMPKTMKQLAWVQFFSWFALFSMWIYTTPALTSTKYDMKIEKPEFNYLKTTLSNTDAIPGSNQWKDIKGVKEDMNLMAKKFEKKEHVPVTIRVAGFFTEKDKNTALKITPEITNRLEFIKKQYNIGADWVTVLFAVYNGVAALVAFLLPVMSRITNRKITHLVCLSLGGLGFISMFFISNPTFIILSMIGIGAAWASILSVPYAMLAGALPPTKMGYYMGVFNFFIVIPQIIAATILGFIIIQFFDTEPIYALIVGGFSMILSGILTLRVHENATIEIKEQQ